MDTLKPILEQHPFFKGLRPEYVDLLVGCASNVVFHTGEYLCREGKDADQFFVLRSGHACIETHSPGRGKIQIETVGDGEVLGWSWLIAPYKWQFDVRALELTRAISLDAKCLRDKCAKDHDLGYEFLSRFTNMIVERLNATRLQLVDIHEGAAAPR